MARVRLELDKDYERRLLASSEMRSMLGRVARAGAEAAKEIAPVGGYAHGGRYRDGIEPDVGENDKGDLVGRVNANYFTSWWLEAGTIRSRPFGVLRKALESGRTRGALR